MRLHLYCVARRPPKWAAEASAEYEKRLTGQLDFRPREIAPCTNAANPEQQREREAQTVLKTLPDNAWLVALDERGSAWTTLQLAARLDDWRQRGGDVVLAVGGAEGHAPEVRAAAQEVWSLSPLTLPHALVRVVVTEQIYRAWSILNHHPYHRA